MEKHERKNYDMPEDQETRRKRSQAITIVSILFFVCIGIDIYLLSNFWDEFKQNLPPVVGHAYNRNLKEIKVEGGSIRYNPKYYNYYIDDSTKGNSSTDKNQLSPEVRKRVIEAVIKEQEQENARAISAQQFSGNGIPSNNGK